MRGQFEITSVITPELYETQFNYQLCQYNKMRECTTYVN